MCLYPQIGKNKKYTENKKNQGNIPLVNDPRTLYIPIGCGNCIECKKQKARAWQARLSEDIKINTNGHFITLTMSNEAYNKINKLIPDIEIKLKENWKGELIKIKERHNIGYLRDNLIFTQAVRYWLERWRKKYKTSLRHWIVTELGHNGTENIHAHGIIWTNHPIEMISKTWQYGFVWTGYTDKGKRINYVNEATINYTTKYINKIDKIHKTYNSIILCSPGIGNNYTNTLAAKNNKYKANKTQETYRTRKGMKINLPIYYRNKLYTEEEKEKLWIEKLDKQERWILGQKIDISKGEEEYKRALKDAQQINKELGYGGLKDWNRAKYEEERRKLIQQKRHVSS